MKETHTSIKKLQEIAEEFGFPSFSKEALAASNTMLASELSPKLIELRTIFVGLIDMTNRCVKEHFLTAKTYDELGTALGELEYMYGRMADNCSSTIQVLATEVSASVGGLLKDKQ